MRNSSKPGLERNAGTSKEPSSNDFPYRSDHYGFIKTGIPAPFLIGRPAGDITARAGRFLTTDYHMPTDIVQPDWNWEGARMLAVFGLITGMRMANQEAMPAWKTDSPYKRARGTNRNQEAIGVRISWRACQQRFPEKRCSAGMHPFTLGCHF